MQKLLEIELFLKSRRCFIHDVFVASIFSALTKEAVDMIPAKARYLLNCCQVFLDCLDEVKRVFGGVHSYFTSILCQI